ncbi:MAG: hypothetical protein WC529_00495 [Candidatus Margulisiibacteriota bacterium]
MGISAVKDRIKYYAARLTGKVMRLDAGKPWPRGLKIGPLTYGEWDTALENIFAIVKTRSALVISYEIARLDDLLTFTYQKALERGMQVENAKIDFYHYKPRLDRRWHPTTELLPTLNRKAAEKLGLASDGEYRTLRKYAGLFINLRIAEALRNQGETLSPDHLQALNDQCEYAGVIFRIKI